MSIELAQFGITVNNILPGMTRTARLDTIISNTSQKTGKPVAEVEKEMEKEIPAKRFGDASEIAAVTAFLATPAAAYVNGESIRVDGGRTGSI
jgi:3-oxoacyl-[acyl-carrier protein] reductase